MTDATNASFNLTSILMSIGSDNGASNSLISGTIYDYANTDTYKSMQIHASVTQNNTTPTNINVTTRSGYYNQTSAISSLVFLPAFGNFTSGTVLLYGVK
jgi:hypothetical protein